MHFREAPDRVAAMSMFEKIAEARIDEAIASGELRPPPEGGLLDLDSYFATPEEWRSTHAMLKGHGFVPPEVDLMKRVDFLKEALAVTADESERSRISMELQICRTAFAMAMERMRMRS
ncbi:DUF1992 domain-containing protein [Luteolibacter ambystomatis]|uniref:DUF1992 domain-containing protein n=1 Tax=Luteolibacter ambystomatis TaxID=2824561 RepID=A0A975J1Z0_9BACT|nr:DnaJ family domain-containing protein [Luteolibacter ambystomatis]QUE52550.1 DUF1992 domain-containing protein [Luteolibacter ambystomatis]